MIRVLQGDNREVLKTLEDQSVHCVVTSPPYFGLRDYGVPGQIGLEDQPHKFVAELVQIFDEVRRVLRDDGTVWLNLGDSYAANRTYQVHKGSKVPDGLKSKDLIGIPWRVALALQGAGWWLRQDIIWHKPNPMPESVLDRCTKAHEYIFLLAKAERYYFDAKAISEPCEVGDNGSSFVSEYDKATKPGLGTGPRAARGKAVSSPRNDGNTWNENNGRGFMPTSDRRNKRSVWSVPGSAFKEAHFATFPPDLIEPCILAGCPEGGTVLDPFGGAGTTGLVADRHKRNAILIELNPEYAEMARKRIYNEAPLFAEVS
jgi:DNA modification methylase